MKTKGSQLAVKGEQKFICPKAPVHASCLMLLEVTGRFHPSAV